MLKNKIIVKKIRNIFILLMAIIIMLGAYHNIRNSKAENVIQIEMEVSDRSNALSPQTIIVDATETNEGNYLLDLPTSVNENIVTRYYTSDGEEIFLETESNTATIQLTEEEVANKKVQVQTDYDTKEVTYNDETKLFYNKELKNKIIDENGESHESDDVIVTGYMPLDTELEVTEIDLATLTNVHLASDKQTMQKAYELSLFQMVEKAVTESADTVEGQTNNDKTNTITENEETSDEDTGNTSEENMEKVEYNPSLYEELITIKLKYAQTGETVTIYSLVDDNQLTEILTTADEKYLRFDSEKTDKTLQYIIATEPKEETEEANTGIDDITMTTQDDGFDMSVMATSDNTVSWEMRNLTKDAANGTIAVDLVAVGQNLTGTSDSTLQASDITVKVGGVTNTTITKTLSSPTFSTNSSTGKKEITYTLTLSNLNSVSSSGGTVQIFLPAGKVRVYQQYVNASTIFDSSGSTSTKLHIGDFVNYDAGTWTSTEISNIKTGLKTSLQTANGTTSLPTGNLQFGGFKTGGSRNGNATANVDVFGDGTNFNYVKDKSTNSAITGWRVFDVNGNTVTLISAGNPEDFYVSTNYGYAGEYVLTGNINTNWSSSEASKYQKRSWSMYVSSAQKASSATVLTQSRLDSWYSKYISANADTYNDDATFQKIYTNSSYYKYQNMIDNYSHYYLGDNREGVALKWFDPRNRYLGYNSNYALGLRVLVTLQSGALFKSERSGTKTVTGGNMSSYGGNQTYNVWDIGQSYNSSGEVSDPEVLGQNSAQNFSLGSVDLIKPIFEKISSTFDRNTKKATINVKGTDDNYASSNLTTNKIKVFVNGAEVTTGLTKTISSATAVNNSSGTQIGNQWTITITGINADANQIIIQIQSGAMTDQAGNTNDATDLIAYNTLKATSSETSATSGFLGNTSIQRQNIENVTFQNSTLGAATAVKQSALIRSFDAYNNTETGHSYMTNTWKDLSGNNDGALYGGVFTKNYLSLDGVDDWVNLGQVSLTNKVTLDAIITAKTIESEWHGILGNWSNGGTGIYLSDGKPKFDVYVTGVGYVSIAASNALTAGVPTRITATYDGTTLALYINGILEVTKTQAGTIGAPINGAGMTIGANPKGTDGTDEDTFANIDVYSAKVYNQALTQAEVQQVWDASAEEDWSILAWTSNSSAPYTVNIGSNDDISANVNSDSLFRNIGYSNICTATKTITNLNLLNTSNTTSMKNMFDYTGYNAMTSLNLGNNFDTRNVTNMFRMFLCTGYTAMTSLDLGNNFDTSNVQDMAGMFNRTGYTAMTSLNLGNKFDTSNVQNMSGMFHWCGMQNMTSLNLGDKFDTSNVTNMGYMFADLGNVSMTEFNLGDKFDTSNVTNMEGMFWSFGYTAMTSLDLGDKFYTTNVTNMYNMFYNCGYTAMQTLDLGPAFTRISDGDVTIDGNTYKAYNNFVTNCGMSGAVIYAPESIYNDRTHLKLNTSSTTTIEYTQGTINPKYRTEWAKETTTIDTTGATPKINITLRGTTNTELAASEYISDVTSTLPTGELTGDNANLVKVYIDETDITSQVTKSVGTATQTDNTRTGAKDILQTITLSGFEEVARQTGKSFKEWSGNISIQPASGTLKDLYGSHTTTDGEGNTVVVTGDQGNGNLASIDTTGSWVDILINDTTQATANTNGKLFADFISPEFTYEYANTTINQGTKTVTVVFDITDKYFNSSTLAASNITVTVDGVTATNATKTLSKISDLTGTINGTAGTKIGERYQLVITDLDQGDADKYSGVMTLGFATGVATDKSTNGNETKTITIGIDDPTTGDGHDSAVIVDVVDPIWKVENINIDQTNKKVTADVIATDKYLAGVEKSTLTTDDITLSVDGDTNANNVITKTLSTPTFSTNSTTGLKEIKYTLTLTNFEEAAKQTGKDYLEYSGTTKISIPADTITDDYTNTSNAQEFVLGYVDFIKPVFEKVSSTVDVTNKTATIVVKGIDKYYASSALTGDKIKVFADGVEVTSGITKTINSTTAVNGPSTQIGNQYSITISGFTQSANQVKMQIQPGAMTDQAGNTNDATYFIIYSCLKATNTETASTSGFLGNTTIQRQNIESVTFKNSTADATSNKWDVSAVQDNSIIAWYTGTGPYQVYIGSHEFMCANANSSYLFSYIGYASTCTATSVINGLEMLNTTTATNMNHMFYNTGYQKMTALDLGNNFDTSNVTDMSNMFEGCGYTAMTNFNLGSKFNTAEVTNMNSMFQSCGYTAMTALNLGSNFNTAKVTNMYRMFRDCGYKVMTTLTLGNNFNTVAVTNMSAMFVRTGYTKLTSLNLGSNFNTAAVTNMEYMFTDCGRLAMTTLTLGSKFNTAKVQNMHQMFYNCGKTALTSLDLGDLFYTTAATNMTDMFNGCGTTAMTTLDLGPAFTKIADTHDNFMTNCGKSGAVIYAPESIYKNRTAFKTSSTDTSTASGTIAVSSGRTINPIYKPEWTKESSSIDTSGKTLSVVVKGSANKSQTINGVTINYSSNVTSTLPTGTLTGNNAKKILVYIDGELDGDTNKNGVLDSGETPSITRTVTKDTTKSTASEVYYTIKLSNLEETVRQSGKNFKEWSGNIEIKIAGRGEATSTYSANVLKDSYGNQNMMETDESGSWINVSFKDGNIVSNTAGKMFADFIKPEFTYEYSNTTIDHGTETVKVVFDITDKYFNSIDTTKLTANNITVTVAGTTVTGVTKQLNKLSNLTATVNGTSTKIGERYELVITGLDQEDANGIGDGYTYSGIMTLAFPADIATDKSGNKSVAKTITVGIDDPTTGDGHNSGAIVDVVDPIWEVVQTEVDQTNKTSTIKLRAKDKYFKQSTLTTNNITVYVNGVASTTVVKTLSAPTDIKETVDGVANTVVGKEYTLTLSNLESTSGSGYVEFTPIDAIVGGTAKYRDENGGSATIEIAAGTIEDQYSNFSNVQSFDVGNIDVTKPEVYQVQSTKNATAKTETIVFNVTDKNYDSTDLVTKSEISVFVDGEQANDINKSSLTSVEIKTTIDGETKVVGHQYTLVLNGFECTTKNAKGYIDWSGTVSIDIAANSAKDTTGNTNIKSTVTGDFVDFINPFITYETSTADIDRIGTDADGKSYQMVFTVIDKYYTSGQLSVNDLTISLADGKNTYNLKSEPVTIKLVKKEDVTASNIKITNTSGTVGTVASAIIGHRYVLTISNLEELEIKTGNTTLDYSGIITLGIAKDKIVDRSGNKNVAKTITSEASLSDGSTTSVVDVVQPIWRRTTGGSIDFETKTANIVVKGTDTYYASNSLTASGIKVYAYTGTTETDITSSVNPQLSTATALNESVTVGGTTSTRQYGVQYTISLTGVPTDKDQVKVVIPAGTLTDQSGNTSEAYEMRLYTTLKSAAGETSATSAFLGNSTLQRQNIESITFKGDTVDANATKWDVSAAQDESIWAWYTGSGPYQVYIGSEEFMCANADSSYLFSYIGYASNCTATSVINGLEMLNTTTATNMIRMFNYCGYNAMTTLNLGNNFDTSNVTDMRSMFRNCGYTAMKTLNLGTKFNTSNVISMRYMFYMCGYDVMESLDLSSGTNSTNTTQFNTSSVQDMTYMFSNCGYRLMTSFNLGNNFDTSEVTLMSDMFRYLGATKMEELDLGDKFNTSKVTDMSNMFNNCGRRALTKLDLGDKFDTSSVTNMSDMFRYAGGDKMTSLDLKDKFYTTNVTDMTNMFLGCGASAMTTLDLGPAFTKVANTNTSFMLSCGKSGAVIYATEAIYKDRTSFKLSSGDTSTASGTIPVSTGRTINPIYKPEWTKVSSSINTTNKTLSVVVKGSASKSQTVNGVTINYSSEVTSTLAPANITVYIDGELATSIGSDDITVSAASPSATSSEVTHTITISNFEETLRQEGKNFKEWSGNVEIKIGGRGQNTSTYTANVLKDDYGNQNMMETDESGSWINVTFKDGNIDTNTNGKMFADFIGPEFTYEYSNTTIDHNAEKVTVVFDITDKYFNSSTITASNITVTVDGTTATNASKTLGKKTLGADETVGNITYKANGDIYYTINGTPTKIGERYQLEITNLDQGDADKYSGIMTLGFPINVATDKSGNQNVSKTITIGKDDPTTGDGHDSGVIVDVVDPIWRTQNFSVDKANKKVTVEIVAADKYLTGTSNCILTNANVANYVSVSVDGDTNANTAITKELSAPAFSTNSDTGLKEITYTLTLSNWEQPTKQSGKNYFEYSGIPKIKIAAGTVTDQYANTSNEQEFTLEHVDFIKPRIEKVSSTKDASAKTETIVFNVIDKYLNTSDAVTESEITVYVDGEIPGDTNKNGVIDGSETLAVTKTLSRVTANDVSETINGSSQVVSQQYKLVISNFEESANNSNGYKDWSGTVSIDIAAGAVKDKEVTLTSGAKSGANTNDKTTLQGDFVDFVNPFITYETSTSDIDRDGVAVDGDGKSYQMVFTVTDKYYASGELSVDDLTITLADGKNTYNLKSEPVSITFVKQEDVMASNVKKTTNTSTGTVETVASTTIGHRYVLTLSNLEELEIKTGNTTLDYSGIITLEIAANKVTDSSGNKNVAKTITSEASLSDGSTTSVVDVVQPIWRRTSGGSIDLTNQTASVVVKGTDTYYASNSLTTSDIKVYAYSGTVETDITSSVNPQLSTATALNESVTVSGTTSTRQYGVQYTISLTGIPIDKDQVKVVILAGTLTDQSGNISEVYEMKLFTTLKSASSETTATSAFLGNSSLKRQNIESITFKDSIEDAASNKWDVSAAQDESIWAWYDVSTGGTEANGPYQVYIGSDEFMCANADSSYLFSYIGYASSCTATSVINGLAFLNTTTATSMNHMFQYCGYQKMTSLNLGSNFNTANVTNMSDMFNGCGYTAMTTFNLGTNFNTVKVTNMTNMFKDCGNTAMQGLDLSSGTTAANTTQFNTSSVTNMSGMFNSCGKTAMVSLNLGNNFDTTEVTDMNNMFFNCGRIAMTNLSLGANFNTSKVTNMRYMFYGCGFTVMTSLNLGEKFDTSKVTNMNSMFMDCGRVAMTSLDLGNLFYTTAVTDMTDMFNGCGAIAMTTLDLGPAFTKIADTHDGFMTNCGTSTLVVYAPESIYSNINAFKLNKAGQ